MLCVAITDEMERWARQKESVHVRGPRFDEAVNKRNSVYLGYLGQAIFTHFYPGSVHVDVGTHDYEILGRKVEVKSWWTKGEPKMEYYVQVPYEDSSRAEGLYVFALVNTQKRKGWLVGWIPVDDFRAIATLRFAGDTRPGGITYSCTCFEVRVGTLRRF